MTSNPFLTPKLVIEQRWLHRTGSVPFIDYFHHFSLPLRRKKVFRSRSYCRIQFLFQPFPDDIEMRFGHRHTKSAVHGFNVHATEHSARAQALENYIHIRTLRRWVGIRISVTWDFMFPSWSCIANCNGSNKYSDDPTGKQETSMPLDS